MRNRSMALVVRNKSIILVREKIDGREFYTLPGGGIENNETPEEEDDDNPIIMDVKWMTIRDLSEKDRAFLWSYGLMDINDFWEEVISWGDAISYPIK